MFVLCCSWLLVGLCCCCVLLLGRKMLRVFAGVAVVCWLLFVLCRLFVVGCVMLGVRCLSCVVR